MICPNCKHVYRIQSGIPNMVIIPVGQGRMKVALTCLLSSSSSQNMRLLVVDPTPKKVPKLRFRCIL